MNENIKRYKFLIGQKSFCTQCPVKPALSESKFQALKTSYKSQYGFDILEAGCPNAFNCLLRNEGCIGRPFPKDPKIYEIISNMNLDIEEGLHRGEEVYMAKATVECHNCPLNDFCDTPCPSVQSYIERRVKPKQDAMSRDLIDFDTWEKGGRKVRMLDSTDLEHCEKGPWANESLPWDCLTEIQRQCLEMSLYDGMNQSDIAYQMGIRQQTVSDYLNQSKAKLAEWGKARKALDLDYNKYAEAYYLRNMTQIEISECFSVHIQTVRQSISQWKSKNIQS